MIQKTSPLTYKNLFQIFEYWAQHNPEHPAVLAPNRPSLTYAALFDQLTTFREKFQDLGLGESARIAVLAPNGPELALAFLCSATSVTCAPLNPAYKNDELAFYLDDLEASALLIASTLESPAREVAHAKNIPVLELCPQTEQAAGCFSIDGKTGLQPLAIQQVRADHVALILHTSGTTALPKQVPLTQRNLCASIVYLQRSLALTPQDPKPSVWPISRKSGPICVRSACANIWRRSLANKQRVRLPLPLHPVLNHRSQMN